MEWMAVFTSLVGPTCRRFRFQWVPYVIHTLFILIPTSFSKKSSSPCPRSSRRLLRPRAASSDRPRARDVSAHELQPAAGASSTGRLPHAPPGRLPRAPPPSRVHGHELELPWGIERQRRGRDGRETREENRSGAERLCFSNSEGRSEPAYWGNILPEAAPLPLLAIQAAAGADRLCSAPMTLQPNKRLELTDALLTRLFNNKRSLH
jgi:hypothetical protein